MGGEGADEMTSPPILSGSIIAARPEAFLDAAALASPACSKQIFMCDRDFGAALEAMKLGRRVARAGWNGKGMWIELVVPSAADCLPYIRMSTADQKLVPWLASQTDLLAHDWRVLPDHRSPAL